MNLPVHVLTNPFRLYDSRYTLPWETNEIRTINVGEYSAVFLNLTATEAQYDGYVTVWSAGRQPDTSNLNFQAYDVANTCWVPVTNRTINIFSSAPVDLIVDIQAVVPI